MSPNDGGDDVVRIFPNDASCLRLIGALAVEMAENWLEAHRYLNMEDLGSTRRRPCAWPPDPNQPAPGQRSRIADRAHHRKL
jgi:Transposase, Mutator family